MRKILIILGLILCGSALFGQSPRIRLNQITKDSLTGSVVLSGSDSNMVYSRDFFLNLTDSVLILFGDTLSTTATAFTGVATDLTLTGNGTVGNELKVDTAIIATVSALADSLAGIISSVTTDLTLTGDGSIATPLKVDTAVIATIRALSDSLATLSFATNQDISDSLATLSFASLQDITDTLDLNTRDYITGLRLTDTLNNNSRGFLTQNQTITLTDDATGSGTTSISVAVVDDSHNHTISTLTGIQDSLNSKAALVHTHTISDVAFLQDSLDAKANDADLNNYLLTSNYIVDSTRINATGDTAYYYQNGVLIGTGAIAGGGGGSGTVTSVDVSGGTTGLTTSGGPVTTSGTITIAGTLDVDNGGTGATSFTSGQMLKGNGTSAIQAASNLRENGDTIVVEKILNVDTSTLFVDAVNNRVGIGTSSPVSKLESKGDITINSQDGGFSSGITINKGISGVTGVSGSEYKNVALFTGYSSSTTLIDYNLTVGLWQKTDVDGNYANYNFFSAQGNNLGGFGMNFVDHSGYISDFYFATSNGAIGSEKMRIKGNGEVFIAGTTDQGAYNLQVNGTGVWGAGAYVNGSDITLKENIQPLNQGLYYINKLNPVQYNYKSTFSTDQSKQLGFIAQDVLLALEDLSDAVVKDAGQTLSMAYQNLIPLAIKAIQEQQAIIESQATEIETLKTQIELILNEIQILKNN